MNSKDRKFRGNSEITSFEEFELFTGITEFSYASRFSDCTNLVSINLSNIMKIAGDNGYTRYGFENCTSLKNVILNPSMTEIGYQAFFKCAALEKIDLSNIKTIYDGAFQGCLSLKEVVSLNKVETIHGRAFLDCTNLSGCLAELSLPHLKGTLGQNAFNNSSVTKVLDLGSVSIVGEGNSGYMYGPFHGCKRLTEVILPATVTSIGFGTFRLCTALQYVKILAIIPPALGDQAFNNTNNCPIYVPAETVDAYKSASGWSEYASRIQAIID